MITKASLSKPGKSNMGLKLVKERGNAGWLPEIEGAPGRETRFFQIPAAEQTACMNAENFTSKY
jgi:hypothetical protein